MAFPRNTETIPSARDVEPIDLAFTPAPWTEKAACLVIGSDPFYPGPGPHTSDTAKAICTGCPVSSECLEFAMRAEADSYRFGVFGGLTADERHALNRQRKAQEASA